MSVKGTIAAAAAVLAVTGWVGVAAALPANAETAECGQSCVELFGGLSATLNNPSYVIDSYKQGQATGTPIIQFPVSDADPSEDFTISDQGLVSAFYAKGQVSAAVDQHYGDDAAYELEYSPYGALTGQCVGVAATAAVGEQVTLQPCGVSGGTVWIADSSASITESFVPLINGSDTDFSDPFVLSYPPGSNPLDTPRPVLYVDNLQQNTAGQVPDSQLWSARGDILGGVLSIAQPANITTDATGPSGATVTYPLPVVSDPDDTSPPAAVCTPASGSVFPIGTTTVTCTATDSKDLNSPVSTSFTITVEGAAAQLADLRQAVHGVGSGNGLASIVAIAQQQVSDGHPELACLTLTGFLIEIRTQTPWSIPPSTAAQLITDAERIMAVLGCGSRPAL
jgi:HYR domain